MKPGRSAAAIVPPVLLLMAAVVYPLWWRSAPVQTPDSPLYLEMARDLREDGTLDALHFRAPGYPLLLVLAGSAGSPTRALFLVTLALYLLSVYVLASMLRRLEMPPWSVLLLGALCVTPPFVEPSAYVMSEAPTAFLLVTALALMAADARAAPPVGAPGPAPSAGGGRSALLPGEAKSALYGAAAGALIGAAALMRPAYQLLGLALAPVLLRAKQGRKAAGLVVVSSALIGGCALVNGAKFGYYGVTPALGWNLSTRTARFVERMPVGPVKDILVERRDEELLRDETHAPAMYIWGVDREALAKAAGLDEAGLARYMTALNLRLARAAPINYLAEVGFACVKFWFPAADKLSIQGSRLRQLVWSLLHFVLAAAFFTQLVAVLGTALTRQLGPVPPRLLSPYVLGLMTIFYTMAISCAADVGSPRYRTPTDGIIVLVTLLGVRIWKDVRAGSISGARSAGEREGATCLSRRVQEIPPGAA